VTHEPEERWDGNVAVSNTSNRWVVNGGGKEGVIRSSVDFSRLKFSHTVSQSFDRIGVTVIA